MIRPYLKTAATYVGCCLFLLVWFICMLNQEKSKTQAYKVALQIDRNQQKEIAMKRKAYIKTKIEELERKVVYQEGRMSVFVTKGKEEDVEAFKAAQHTVNGYKHTIGVLNEVLKYEPN